MTGTDIACIVVGSLHRAQALPAPAFEESDAAEFTTVRRDPNWGWQRAIWGRSRTSHNGPSKADAGAAGCLGIRDWPRYPGELSQVLIGPA